MDIFVLVTHVATQLLYDPWSLEDILVFTNEERAERAKVGFLNIHGDDGKATITKQRLLEGT